MQIGTIWIILGILFTAIGSIMGYHGYQLNQQASEKRFLSQQKESEQKIIDHQKKAESTVINELKKEIATLQNDKRKELSSQFPDGYQLFGIVNKKIIPSEKPFSDDVKLSWDTAKILNITKDFVYIKLPEAIFPGNNKVNLTMRVKNEEGTTSSMNFGVIHDLHIRPFVKILKSSGKEIIAAVGFEIKKI